ncbi:MAG: peptidylprolyl isomerase [Fibrobacterota bacterium]
MGNNEEKSKGSFMLMSSLRSGNFVIFVMAGVIFFFVFTIFWSWGMGGEKFSGNNVGEINGREISYGEFERALENAAANMRREKTELSGLDYRNMRKQVWQQFVSRMLLEDLKEKLDIKASDAQIADFFMKNPPQGVRSYEGFQTDGRFDEQKYKEFLKSDQASSNPYIIEYEKDAVEYSIPLLVLQQLLDYVPHVTSKTLDSRLLLSEGSADIEYVYANSAKLDEDALSEENVRNFYNENPQEFKDSASVSLEYAYIPKKPRQEDSTETRNDIFYVYNKITEEGEDFREFVAAYSEDQATNMKGGFIGMTLTDSNELSTDYPVTVYKAAKKAPSGGVAPPVRSGGGWHLVYTGEPTRLRRIKASHILVSGRDMADSVTDVLKDTSFAAVAAEYSTDEATAASGGDLGFFARGRMDPAFEEVAFSMEKGEVSEPVRSRLGYHIIKVTDKEMFTDKKARIPVSHIYIPLKAGPQTVEILRERCDSLVNVINSGDLDLKEAADSAGFKYGKTDFFSRSELPQGFNTPETYMMGMVSYAFSDSSMEKAGPVFDNDKALYILRASARYPAGTIPFEHVKREASGLLRQSLMEEKKKAVADKVWQSVSSGGSLEEAASADEAVNYNKYDGATYEKFIPGLGYKSPVVVKVLMSEENEYTGPVLTASTYAIARPLKISAPVDNPDAAGKKSVFKNTLFRSRRVAAEEAVASWFRETSDIEDNRDKFYRD